MRDTSQQIPHSKVQVDRLNLLCCDEASVLDTFHCSATKQAGALTPRLLHALSVE